MDRWMTYLVLFLLVIIFSVFSFAYNTDEFYDSNKFNSFGLDETNVNISDILSTSSEKVKVIVELKEKPKGVAKAVAKIGLTANGENEINNLVEENNNITNKNYEFNSFEGYSIDLSLDEINQLIYDPNVESISLVMPKYLFLDDSVPLINATRAWQIQNDEINMTGVGQTVCIIDSGVNSSHPDISGKVIAEKCFCSAHPIHGRTDHCCPNGLAEDDDAEDLIGHGTHISGIVAANGGKKGVAPGANIIAVKVFGSTNIAFDDDIVRAIEWCTENSEIYNISVITLSLGVNCALYPNACSSSFCDSSYSFYSNAINASVAKNISVTIASGNSGQNNLIASPACITNAIPVASSTKTDLISSFSDLNNYLNILAPGQSIISLRLNPNSCSSGCSCLGNYMQCSGTSMAAPHVAGTIAILRQYLDSINVSKTPKQIEYILNDTGYKITNVSRNNKTFSKINVYSALSRVEDLDQPLVNLSNLDRGYYPEGNIKLNCSIYDSYSISNVSLYTNGSSWNIMGTNNSGLKDSNYSFDILMHEGDYIWNCEACDTLQCSFASTNNTIFVRRDIDNDKIVDELDNCLFVYNPDQIDTNSNGIGDVCENDYDGDGLNDSIDALFGNMSHIRILNSSINNLSILINESNNLSQLFSNINVVTFLDSLSPVLEFTYDFSTATVLNLANIEIISQTNPDESNFVIIKGLNLSSLNNESFNYTKTVYFNRTNTATNRICIKDQELSSISEISSNCEGINEFSLECNGIIVGNYECNLLNSTIYQVSGLSHSGVKEYIYVPDVPLNRPSGGGSSSGGSSFSNTVCIPSWNCSVWTECINGYYRRTCEDLNDCKNDTDKPELMLRCEIKTSSRSENNDTNQNNENVENLSVDKGMDYNIEQPKEFFLNTDNSSESKNWDINFGDSYLWWLIGFVLISILIGVSLSFLWPGFFEKKL